MIDEDILKRIIEEKDGITPNSIKMSMDIDTVYYGYTAHLFCVVSEVKSPKVLHGKFKQKITRAYFNQKKREYKLEELGV